MKVSVVIPTYNRSAQVLRTLESVFAQTIPVDEVIVVDDGSTDGTAEHIQTHHGSRVRVVSQNNRGVSAARNKGICEAKAEWVAFLDSDDIWRPTKIQEQLHAIGVTGDKAGFCFTDNFFEGDPSRKLSRFEEVGFHTSTQFGILDEPSKLILLNREPFFTSSVMVRRSLFRDMPGFDERMNIGEDTDVFFRLSLRTSFCFVAKPLVSIDRTPTREQGLCNLYLTRNDQKYEQLELRFTKWLAMPEVSGSDYERPARESLRNIWYNSAECKLRQFRFIPALRELNKLNELGDRYTSIVAHLAARKIRKLSHRVVQA